MAIIGQDFAQGPVTYDQDYHDEHYLGITGDDVIGNGFIAYLYTPEGTHIEPVQGQIFPRGYE